MLNDAVCFKNVYIVTGYTDLRFGIDSLAALIKSKLGKEPLVPDTLYLFCGRRTDRIKGLVWESNGYLLLYKRLEQGNFRKRTIVGARNSTGPHLHFEMRIHDEVVDPLDYVDLESD